MGIKINFNGAAISKPGGYSALKMSPLTGAPLTSTGVVGIIGPADGGEPGFAGPYSGANIQAAKLLYKSGPIADAFDLLVNPSNDERIVNGASEIYVYKVNPSTQATLSLASGWGELSSSLYGLQANQTTFKIENTQAEVLPTFSFTYAAPATDVKFDARINGGAVGTSTVLSTDTTGALAAAKIDGINGISASAVGALITVATSLTTSDGIGASLEVIDGGGSNGLASIGVPSSVIGAITASSAEVAVQYTANHPSYDEEISDSLGGDIAFNIGYVGTTASITITETTLATTVVGGTGASLAITFSDYNNLQEIVDFINVQTGYTCSTAYAGATTSAATILDNVTANGIATSASSILPGRIKKDSNVVASYINEISELVEVVETSLQGLPDVVALSYLSGAVLGAAANSDFQTGFDSFKLKRMNTVIPLIADDGSTEGYGSYDWDTVSAQHSTHIKWGWSTNGKSERNGYIGFDGTKDELKAKLLVINSGYISLTGQDAKRVSAEGTLEFMKPWAMACIIAGMQNGSEVGEPPTYKYINASGVQQDSSWDPKLDYTEMIDAGLTFVESVDSGGFRIVVGNTTYGKDANFVWNRISVVEAGGYVSYDLRTILESKYTGNKAASGIAVAMKNFIIARMTDYLAADIIVADDNAPLGYKDLSVTVDGNTAIINVTIFPVSGIDFILNTIYLESAVQTA